MAIANLQVVVTASAEVTPARKPDVGLGDVTPDRTTGSNTDSTALEKE